MSNAPSREQDKLIEQSKQQRDPGSAKASDFTVRPSGDSPVPLHHQHGRTVREKKRLIAEGMSRRGSGKSKPQPIPDRHYAPKQPSASNL